MQQQQIQTFHQPKPSVPTCLIIEDSEYDQRMMKRVLDRSKINMRIQVASTLHSARKALEYQAVSLILLDNNLPDGFGVNFAMELATDNRLGNIPVIMVSDWPSPFMWEKAASAGVLHVINKSEFGARYVHSALKTIRRRMKVLH